MKRTRCILVAAAALALSACATSTPRDDSYPGRSPSTRTYPTYPERQAVRYGYVESVEVVPASTQSQGPGVGAIGGAIAGGVLGNIIAPGRSDTLGTILGAVAGGAAGRAIDRNDVRCR